MGRVAAVDCGTNSFRLLIAEAGDGHLRALDRRAVITRLGQGVDASRRLDPEAIARGVAVLRDFGAAIRDAGAGAVRMTATSAARDAANADEFRAAATEAVGVEPEVISGAEEAALSFRGATFEFPPDSGQLLVLDIGGGSTEFVAGLPGQDPIASISTDMGCVRLTEKFFTGDPPDPFGLAEALSFVEDRLVEVEAAVPVFDTRHLVGVAGTITTLAAVHLGLERYDPDRTHHHVLDHAAVEGLFRRFASETQAEIREDPAIEPARADAITAGALILVGIMRRWSVTEIVVSETDILDGIALSLA